MKTQTLWLRYGNFRDARFAVEMMKHGLKADQCKFFPREGGILLAICPFPILEEDDTYRNKPYFYHGYGDISGHLSVRKEHPTAY